MSTTCTITRLVRWRVRDWASCFYASRFPLDEEPDTYSSTSPRLSTKTIEYNRKGETRSKEHDRKKAHDNTCNQEKESTINKAAEETSDSSWPHFEEDDYIVFCFKEDGEIHLIEDRRSEASDQINSANRTSKPVNWKLRYSDNVEEAPDSSHGHMVNEDEKDKYPENEGDIHIMDRQGEKLGDNGSDPEWLPDEIKEISHVEETKECKPGSAESSGSKLLDASSSSFTFPVLSSEWMGSPVKMPKSESLDMRKSKERRVRLQCCRF